MHETYIGGKEKNKRCNLKRLTIELLQSEASIFCNVEGIVRVK